MVWKSVLRSSVPACQVWKDALSSKADAPYLNHEVPGNLRSLAFCPYEDVLAAGHAAGLSTVTSACPQRHP